METQDWARSLRDNTIQCDGTHIIKARSRAEELDIALELCREIDKQKSHIIAQHLYEAAIISKELEKELEEKMQRELELEAARKKREEDAEYELNGKEKYKTGLKLKDNGKNITRSKGRDYDNEEDKQLKRVKPNPLFQTRLLNLADFPRKKPSSDSCYDNYPMWSKKAARLETLFRQRFKDLNIATIPTYGVLSVLKEGMTLSLCDMIFHEVESGVASLQHFTTSHLGLLHEECCLKIEIDSHALTYVNDFLSLSKIVRHHGHHLPAHLLTKHFGVSRDCESDVKVDAVLIGITARQHKFHLRPLCTTADVVLALHELPTLFSQAIIYLPYIHATNRSRVQHSFYRYRYSAKGQPVFSFLRLKMFYEVKELLPYLFPVLPFTNEFYDIEEVPLNQVPKELQDQCRVWVYHVNNLYHAENEVIDEMIVDIEYAIIETDVSLRATTMKLDQNVGETTYSSCYVPHLQASNIPLQEQIEYAYRIINFHKMTMIPSLSAGRRKPIFNIDGITVRYMRDFHDYFHSAWKKLEEERFLRLAMRSVSNANIDFTLLANNVNRVENYDLLNEAQLQANKFANKLHVNNMIRRESVEDTMALWNETLTSMSFSFDPLDHQDKQPMEGLHLLPTVEEWGPYIEPDKSYDEESDAQLNELKLNKRNETKTVMVEEHKNDEMRCKTDPSSKALLQKHRQKINRFMQSMSKSAKLTKKPTVAKAELETQIPVAKDMTELHDQLVSYQTNLHALNTFLHLSIENDKLQNRSDENVPKIQINKNLQQQATVDNNNEFTEEEKDKLKKRKHMWNERVRAENDRNYYQDKLNSDIYHIVESMDVLSMLQSDVPKLMYQRLNQHQQKLSSLPSSPRHGSLRKSFARSPRVRRNSMEFSNRLKSQDSRDSMLFSVCEQQEEGLTDLLPNIHVDLLPEVMLEQTNIVPQRDETPTSLLQIVSVLSTDERPPLNQLPFTSAVQKQDPELLNEHMFSSTTSLVFPTEERHTTAMRRNAPSSTKKGNYVFHSYVDQTLSQSMDDRQKSALQSDNAAEILVNDLIHGLDQKALTKTLSKVVHKIRDKLAQCVASWKEQKKTQFIRRKRRQESLTDEQVKRLQDFYHVIPLLGLADDQLHESDDSENEQKKEQAQGERLVGELLGDMVNDDGLHAMIEMRKQAEIEGKLMQRRSFMEAHALISSLPVPTSPTSPTGTPRIPRFSVTITSSTSPTKPPITKLLDEKDHDCSLIVDNKADDITTQAHTNVVKEVAPLVSSPRASPRATSPRAISPPMTSHLSNSRRQSTRYSQHKNINNIILDGRELLIQPRNDSEKNEDEKSDKFLHVFTSLMDELSATTMLLDEYFAAANASHKPGRLWGSSSAYSATMSEEEGSVDPNLTYVDEEAYLLEANTSSFTESGEAISFVTYDQPNDWSVDSQLLQTLATNKNTTRPATSSLIRGQVDPLCAGPKRRPWSSRPVTASRVVTAPSTSTVAPIVINGQREVIVDDQEVNNNNELVMAGGEMDGVELDDSTCPDDDEEEDDQMMHSSLSMQYTMSQITAENSLYHSFVHDDADNSNQENILNNISTANTINTNTTISTSHPKAINNTIATTINPSATTATTTDNTKKPTTGNNKHAAKKGNNTSILPSIIPFPIITTTNTLSTRPNTTQSLHLNTNNAHPTQNQHASLPSTPVGHIYNHLVTTSNQIKQSHPQSPAHITSATITSALTPSRPGTIHSPSRPTTTSNLRKHTVNTTTIATSKTTNSTVVCYIPVVQSPRLPPTTPSQSLSSGDDGNRVISPSPSTHSSATNLQLHSNLHFLSYHLPNESSIHTTHSMLTTTTNHSLHPPELHAIPPPSSLLSSWPQKPSWDSVASQESLFFLNPAQMSSGELSELFHNHATSPTATAKNINPRNPLLIPTVMPSLPLPISSASHFPSPNAQKRNLKAQLKSSTPASSSVAQFPNY